MNSAISANLENRSLAGKAEDNKQEEEEKKEKGGREEGRKKGTALRQIIKPLKEVRK